MQLKIYAKEVFLNGWCEENYRNHRLWPDRVVCLRTDYNTSRAWLGDRLCPRFRQRSPGGASPSCCFRGTRGFRISKAGHGLRVCPSWCVWRVWSDVPRGDGLLPAVSHCPRGCRAREYAQGDGQQVRDSALYPPWRCYGTRFDYRRPR